MTMLEPIKCTLVCLILLIINGCNINSELGNSDLLQGNELLKSSDSCFGGFTEVVVKFLPNDLNTPTGLTDSLRFIRFTSEYWDSVNFKPNDWKFCIGGEITNTSTIDIRTMFTLVDSVSSKTYFMSVQGNILFDGKIYSGSRDQMNFIRSGGTVSVPD